MPRSLVPETFGPEYPELLRRAQRDGRLILPFSTKRDAHLFRLRLYSYFRALRADGRAKDLIALANAFSITFTIGAESQTAELHIVPSSTLPDRQYLRDFLDLKPSPLPGEPLTVGSLTEKLKVMREKKGK